MSQLGRYFYSHFTDEKTETQSLSYLLKSAQFESYRDKIKIQTSSDSTNSDFLITA